MVVHKSVKLVFSLNRIDAAHVNTKNEMTKMTRNLAISTNILPIIQINGPNVLVTSNTNNVQLHCNPSKIASMISI